MKQLHCCVRKTSQPKEIWSYSVLHSYSIWWCGPCRTQNFGPPQSIIPGAFATPPATDKASKLTLVRDSGVLHVTSVDSIQKCILISYTSSPTKYVKDFSDVLHNLRLCHACILLFPCVLEYKRTGNVFWTNITECVLKWYHRIKHKR